MPYALENALFQWRGGERRLTDAAGSERRRLESAVDALVPELRKRLGSSFSVGELADYYAESTDWALELAQRHTEPADAADAVDAAFGRYAREAADYGGGRALETRAKP
jgi:hypothetical protein